MSVTEPAELAEEGKRLYAQGRFEEAAAVFERATEGFTLGRMGTLAAETQNNRSVAHLRAGQADLALKAALGTDLVFAGAGDTRKQAMALGNIAAAHEALGNSDEAVALYERSAELFAQVGDSDLRSTVLKSAAAIDLKRGRVMESGLKMASALDAVERPNLLQRALRSILRPRQ